jgi:hypothetical protein
MKLCDFRQWLLTVSGWYFVGRWWRAISKICSSNLDRIGDFDQTSLLSSIRQAGDRRQLWKLARSAAHPAVRLEAALRGVDPAALTAIALNEWDIPRGLRALNAIDNPLLLRRIARSARQDAIRAEAALKLGHREVLHETAQTVSDVRWRWEIARRLKDPVLMANVACFKPDNERFAGLRNEAHRQLLRHFEMLRLQENAAALKAAIATVPFVRYRIEAFLRLPLDAISDTILQTLARQKLRGIPDDLICEFFDRIGVAGWNILGSNDIHDCLHCRGNGRSAIRCAAEDLTEACNNELPCPECGGVGTMAFRTFALHRDNRSAIVFRLAETEDDYLNQ